MSDFISDYFKTVEETESPFQYHVWAMLSVLSSGAGRRFWFQLGPFNYYTNLYVVLVGDPGVTKSSALGRAANIVHLSKICPVAATQTSKEAMTLEMSHEKFPGRKYFRHENVVQEYNQYAIYAGELTQFIGINPIGFLDFLTTIWDRPVYEVKTKNKGNDFIQGPYINMLACMTPEIVKGFLKQNILSGGFARRTAWVFASTSAVIPIPSYTDEQKAAEIRCVEFLIRLQERSGQFDWTKELETFYVDWYVKNKETIRDRHPSTRGWFQSKAEMLFKLSMLICLAEEGPLVLELRHWKIALKFCEYVEKDLERVFEGSGINPNANAAAQICRMLAAMDRPMSRKKIEAMFFDQATNLNELRDTINHLISVGKLAERELFGVVNGVRQTLGKLIGTSESFAPYSDEVLATFLLPTPQPLTVSYTDSGPGVDQPASPPSQPAGSPQVGNPVVPLSESPAFFVRIQLKGLDSEDPTTPHQD